MKPWDEVRGYIIVGLKGTATSVLSVISVGLVAIALVSVLGLQMVAPILSGAVPLMAPSVFDTLWNISQLAAALAAMVAILIISIPMYVVAWGFWGQNLFGFVPGQRGIFGYINVGIRDLLSGGVAYAVTTVMAILAPFTGGASGLIGIVLHLLVYGFIAVNIMGFRRN